MNVSPVLIQNSVKVDLSVLEISPLQHHTSKHNVLLLVHTFNSNNFVKILLSFSLHMEFQGEKSKLVPLFGVCGLINKHIYVFTLSILHITYNVELLS